MIFPMQHKSLSALLKFAILSVAPICTLAITPFTSMDGMTVPKLTVLFILAASILSIILINIRIIKFFLDPVLIVLVFLFLIQLFLVLFLAPGPINQQLYGINGRNTGFLTYFSLVVVLVGASVSVNLFQKSYISCALLITGTIEIVYTTLQTFGFDPIDWKLDYNRVIGTFGNPNFVSSFLGFNLIALGALFLKTNIRLIFRFWIIVAASWIILIILRSDSIQGFFVAAAGLVFICYSFLLTRISKLILKSFITSAFAIVTLISLGILNYGPLATYLHQGSIRQRTFYWDAAIKAMNSHPLFGVGMDSFGDWYLRYRSASAALVSQSTQTNAAHNVFLDLGANGGYPLFLIHLAFVGYTIFCIKKYLKQKPNFDWSYAAIVGVWIGYEIQSLISINQIGLASWGWVTMGIIIGLSNKTQLLVKVGTNKQSIGHSDMPRFKDRTIFAVAISSAASLLVIYPFFRADSNYRNAVESRVVENIVTATKAYPEDLARTYAAAKLLSEGKYMAEANSLLSHILQVNPNYTNAWQLSYLTSEPNSTQNRIAIKNINRLNPRSQIK